MNNNCVWENKKMKRKDKLKWYDEQEWFIWIE
jgi:hypothetical protein